MRIVCWNMRRASRNSPAWDHFIDLAPDLALLQEVGSMPRPVQELYSVNGLKAVTKSGRLQRFGTFILAREAEVTPFHLESEVDWVDEQLRHFAGNLVASRVRFSGTAFSVVSVYSPAWPLPREVWSGIDVSTIKLDLNPDIWVTELLWAAIKDRKIQDGWIVGGDLNSSETFDYMWSGGPRGNKQILDRMDAGGFTEVLRHSQGQLTPTFRNPRGGRIVHQMDHLFVSNDFLPRLQSCVVGDASQVFDFSLSDHLPIVADFAPDRL